jgi:hypothetical protein
MTGSIEQGVVAAALAVPTCGSSARASPPQGRA